MKQSLSSFIAWRYLRFPEKDHNITVMMRICFLGIFIGTFSLMLTLIITNGFEKTIHEKMQGISAQFIINSFGNKLDYNEVKTALLKEFPTTIAAISGYSDKQAIIEHNGEHIMLFMRGIDPVDDHRVSSIAQKIIKPRLKYATSLPKLLPALLKQNDIIIGHKLAKTLHCKIGDIISVLIPEPRSKKTIGLTAHQVTIRGFFNVGLEEYDSSLALCSLSYFNELYQEEGVEQLTVRLHDPVQSFTDLYTHHRGNWARLACAATCLMLKKIKALVIPTNTEQHALKALKKFLPSMTVRHWQELYPGLVSSLKLEKYFSFGVLALITLVASLNMIALLFMQIQQKRRDIAILKAMGMPDRAIQAIFLRTGLTITFWSSLCGLFAAGLAGYLLQCYPFITLPDVYYISYLPARLDPEIFLVVFIATMLLGFCATWIPARQSRSLTVAQVLREE